MIDDWSQDTTGFILQTDISKLYSFVFVWSSDRYYVCRRSRVARYNRFHSTNGYPLGLGFISCVIRHHTSRTCHFEAGFMHCIQPSSTPLLPWNQPSESQFNGISTQNKNAISPSIYTYADCIGVLGLGSAVGAHKAKGRCRRPKETGGDGASNVNRKWPSCLLLIWVNN